MSKVLITFILLILVSCDYPLPEDLQFDGADYVLERLDPVSYTHLTLPTKA